MFRHEVVVQEGEKLQALWGTAAIQIEQREKKRLNNNKGQHLTDMVHKCYLKGLGISRHS